MNHFGADYELIIKFIKYCKPESAAQVHHAVSTLLACNHAHEISKIVNIAYSLDEDLNKMKNNGCKYCIETPDELFDLEEGEKAFESRLNYALNALFNHHELH